MLPKNVVRWGIAAAVVAVAAIVITVMVIIGTGKPAVRRVTPDQLDAVSVEVRSNQRGTVYLDEHEVGTTPIMLHVPRSDKPREVSIKAAGKRLVKQIVPDHIQRVDFIYH